MQAIIRKSLSAEVVSWPLPTPPLKGLQADWPIHILSSSNHRADLRVAPIQRGTVLKQLFAPAGRNPAMLSDQPSDKPRLTMPKTTTAQTYMNFTTIPVVKRTSKM